MDDAGARPVYLYEGVNFLARDVYRKWACNRRDTYEVTSMKGKQSTCLVAMETVHKPLVGVRITILSFETVLDVVFLLVLVFYKWK
jgi:hypothetical protein